GKIVPESFTLAARFSADSRRSPKRPAGPTASATGARISAGRLGLKTWVPTNQTASAAATKPAIVPSHVLPGLIRGASLRRPAREPTKYPAMSAAHVGSNAMNTQG